MNKTLPVMHWGRVWAQADLGGWVFAKVRPRWYWKLCRLRATLWLWRRRYEETSKPFTFADAWEIAAYAEGLSRVPYHRTGFSQQQGCLNER